MTINRRDFLGTALVAAPIVGESRESGMTEWVVLELLGRQTVAGVMSHVKIGGCPFFRVDVPDEDGAGYRETKYFSPNAVYAFKVVDRPTVMTHHTVTRKYVGWHNDVRYVGNDGWS